MIIIAVVDDDFGMTFNNRRQSMDIELRRKVYGLAFGSLLFMNGYSYKQYREDENSNIDADMIDYFKSNIIVSEDFLAEAGTGAYCFVENNSVMPYSDKIEKMIIFRWNKKYPSDTRLDYIPKDNGMTMIETLDFAGKSHEKITMEIWE